METNKEWKKKTKQNTNAASVIVYGQGITMKATSTTSGNKIYRSISLVWILCIYFCWSIDAWKRQWSLPVNRVRDSLFYCNAWRKNGKSDKPSHYTTHHIKHTRKNKKWTNKRAKLLCIYSNCNHYYVVLLALAYVCAAHSKYARHLLLQCENNSAIH